MVINKRQYDGHYSPPRVRRVCFCSVGNKQKDAGVDPLPEEAHIPDIKAVSVSLSGIRGLSRPSSETAGRIGKRDVIMFEIGRAHV